MVIKSFSSKISKYLNNNQVTGNKYFYISNIKFKMEGCLNNFVLQTTKKITQYLFFFQQRQIFGKIFGNFAQLKIFEHNWIKNSTSAWFTFVQILQPGGLGFINLNIQRGNVYKFHLLPHLHVILFSASVKLGETSTEK